jgi:hypothetical protein
MEELFGTRRSKGVHQKHNCMAQADVPLVPPRLHNGPTAAVPVVCGSTPMCFTQRVKIHTLLSDMRLIASSIASSSHCQVYLTTKLLLVRPCCPWCCPCSVKKRWEGKGKRGGEPYRLRYTAAAPPSSSPLRICPTCRSVPYLQVVPLSVYLQVSAQIT